MIGQKEDKDPEDCFFLSGECVVSSVLSCCNKNVKQQTDQRYSPLMDQGYSSVLQLSFI